MRQITIVPAPKKIIYGNGCVQMRGLNICSGAELLARCSADKLAPFVAQDGIQTVLALDNNYGDEQYVVEIDETIKLTAGSQKGLHYATLTLVQALKQCSSELPCVRIEDAPDLAMRGLMLDVSRGKVPTVETAKQAIDLLSELKANVLQLYVEGRAFYYPSKAAYYAEPQDFLTAEDVAELREYARQRFVELVPCGNCYGHMTYWLNQGEFNGLAHSPDGFDWSKGGLHCPAGTLDASNPQSLAFVKGLFDEMLPCFGDAKYCNIGGDEPFDTLFGDKKLDDDGKTYFAHVGKVCDYIRARGMTPMLWGDVAHNHPDKFNSLGDAVFLEWRYEPGQFTDDACEVYRQHGARFVVCPSTAFANTLTGWTDKAITNIAEAAACGKRCGAEGLLNTEWGDGGYTTTRATGVLLESVGACYAWNATEFAIEELCAWLDKEIYGAELASVVADLGRYESCQTQPMHMLPYLFSALYVRGLDCMQVDYDNYSDPTAFFRRDELLTEEECSATDALLDRIEQRMPADGANGYIREAQASLQLLRFAVMHNRVCLSLRNNKPVLDEIRRAADMADVVWAQMTDVWFLRNKRSDYELATFRLRRLARRYRELLKELSR